MGFPTDGGRRDRGAAGLLEGLVAEAGDVSGVIGYLEPDRDHTAYRQRLAEERPIGSGTVEGACKTAFGLQLKQAGARL